MFHTLAEKLQRAPVGNQAAGRICTAKDPQETKQPITKESHMQTRTSIQLLMQISKSAPLLAQTRPVVPTTSERCA